MKKLIVVGIIILLVGFSVPSAGINVEKSIKSFNGNTLYVGGDGPGNYTRIQDAIDDASDGDTVFVFSGTYYENVIIDKSISLIGEHNEITIIDGGGNSDVIFISADFVKVSNLKIQNSGNESSEFLNIFDSGIELFSNKSIISNSIFDSNKIDIFLNYSDNNSIINNNLISNKGDGVRIRYSDSNIVNHNVIMNQAWGVYLAFCTLNTISNNLISNHNRTGVGVSLNTIENTVSNNTIRNNDEGIGIKGYGVFYNRKNRICDNVIENNNYGIDLYTSYSHIIKSNLIQNNYKSAITIESSGKHTIIGNIIRNSKIGLELSYSNKNQIENNEISDNNLGIYLNYASDSSIIANNFIKHRRYVRSFLADNKWDANYWNKPRDNPKRILTWNKFCILEPVGYFPGLYLTYPWFEYDLHPAKEPNDIGV